MSSFDIAGIVAAGSGLPCRYDCGKRFHPVVAPMFLSSRSKESFDRDALRDAIERRKAHELIAHAGERLKVEA